MASAGLLRSLARGSPLLRKPTSCLLRPELTTKSFTVTPASSGALDYFRARRGPFTPAEKQGNHMMFSSTHWKMERILAVSMIGILPSALIYQGPVMDVLLSTSVFMHGFWILPALAVFLSYRIVQLITGGERPWGTSIHYFRAFDHVLSDYARKFIPWCHKLWFFLSICAFAGLVHFNYNDVGVTKAVSMLWKL